MLPADSLGERIVNAIFLGLLVAFVVDLLIVAIATGIVVAGLLLGVPLFGLSTYYTLAMIAVGGTTFAAPQGSFFLTKIDKMFAWGYKKPPASEQPVKIKLPRNKPQNSAYERRLEKAYSQGKPKVQTLDRSNAVQNRKDSLKNVPTKNNYDRDEYPMAFTKEGGAGANVEYLDPSVNRSVGATIGNKLRPYSDGTKFVIEFVDDAAASGGTH